MIQVNFFLNKIIFSLCKQNKKACNHKVTRSFVWVIFYLLTVFICRLGPFSLSVNNTSTGSGTELYTTLGCICTPLRYVRLLYLFKVCVLNVVASVLRRSTTLSASSVSCVVHILACCVECIVKFFCSSVDSV